MMNDNEANFSHANGDGVKSTDEEPVQEFQQLIYNVEEVSQRRPVVRFGALVLAVGVGSYFGVGRHVKKLAKATKDVRDIRDTVFGIGELVVAEVNMREGQAKIVSEALASGRAVKHFPGLGVWVGDIPNG